MKNPQKVNLTSSNLSEEKLAELYRILPEAFAENKIDFDKLRTVLGDSIVQGSDKFSFSWAGKSNAIKNVLVPSHLTLNPEPKQSIKWDESENLFIEGDNLEVLKLLQKAYFEKVKMIYIDPPYNTGHDFVYNDDFSAPLDNYLKQTGQKNGDGDSTTTNKETNGRYHSDWLSMMYPRLKLAWNLLRDDGVIFMSINDIEAHHLRMLMDEIFGEENFLAQLIWHNKRGGGNDAKFAAIEHEYIIFYAKNKETLDKLFFAHSEDYLERYNEEDTKGKFFWDTFKRKSGKQYYSITCPDGTVLSKDEQGNQLSWLRSEARFKKDLAEGEVRFAQTRAGWSVQFKQRIPVGKKPRSILTDFGTTSSGNKELIDIFGNDKIFSNPKPSELVGHFIDFTTGDGDIILDFFAGSGTTAHALLKANSEEVNRKFILVQLPENIDADSESYKAGYKTIADVSRERIRRVINGYGENPQPIDAGFKAFVLSESNYSENNFVLDPEKSPEENQKEFVAYLHKAKQAKLFSKDNDTSLVYENIVKEGLSLNSKVEKVTIGKNGVYHVVDGDQQLLICLEDKLSPETVIALTDKSNKDRIFICLESSLDDTTAANLSLNLDLKTI
jgi:adenine-specific DNA-methyltransferase